MAENIRYFLKIIHHLYFDSVITILLIPICLGPVLVAFFISNTSTVAVVCISQSIMFLLRKQVYYILIKTLFTVVGVSNTNSRKNISEWCKENCRRPFFYLGEFLIGDLGLEERKDLHYFIFLSQKDAMVFRIRFGVS